MKNFKKIALITAVSSLLLAGQAHAVVDMAPIQAELDLMPGYMTAVGSALVLAAVTSVAFKWVKGAIFG